MSRHVDNLDPSKRYILGYENRPEWWVAWHDSGKWFHIFWKANIYTGIDDPMIIDIIGITAWAKREQGRVVMEDRCSLHWLECAECGGLVRDDYLCQPCRGKS